MTTSERTSPEAAWISYRDLGPRRSIVAAYRQLTGRADAKRASRHWSRWVRKHHWRTRAAAWDAQRTTPAPEPHDTASQQFRVRWPVLFRGRLYRRGEILTVPDGLPLWRWHHLLRGQRIVQVP